MAEILLHELLVEGGRVQPAGAGVEEKDYSELVERLVTIKWRHHVGEAVAMPKLEICIYCKKSIGEDQKFVEVPPAATRRAEACGASRL
jgi:hypothetical protein